jgi:hypothetical protein
MRARRLAQGAHTAIDFPIEYRCSIGEAQYLADQSDRVLDRGESLSIECHRLHPELLQAGGDSLRMTEEHHIGPQAHDLLDLGVVQAAGLG